MGTFSDDFNRADSTVVGNGWLEIEAAIYEIFGSKLRASVAPGNFADAQLLRPDVEAFADGTLKLDFNYINTATGSAPQLHGRCQGTNYNTFYLVFHSGSFFYLARSTGGGFTALNSQNVGALSAGTIYRYTLIMAGNSFTATLENVSLGTVISTLTATDATYPGAGNQAISRNNGGDIIDYDNFYASNVTVKSVTDSGVGTDTVTIGSGVTVKSVTDSGVGTDSVAVKAFISVVDSGAGKEAVSGPPEQPLLSLLERFDGTLASWTLDQTGGTAAISNGKLVLTDTLTTAQVSATRANEPQIRPFIIEFDASAALNALGYLEALDSAGAVILSVKVDGISSTGVFDTNADTPASFSWAADTPAQIVIYVDTAAGTARLFYSTGTGTTPSGWAAVLPVKAYTGLVSQVRFRTDVGGMGAASFDEVRVYRPGIFCVGDSNTAGYGPGSTPGWNPNPASTERGLYADAAHSYPYKLGQKFNPARWIADRGVNSDKSADVDGRILTSVVEQGASTVVILIGTNDIGITPDATIEANISSAAAKAASAGVAVVLCSIPPCNSWVASANASRDAVNAWIQAHCASNGYTFADAYSAIKNPANPNQINPAYDAGDGLHFSHAGLQAIADTVYNSMFLKAIADSGVGTDAVQVRRIVSVSDAGVGNEGVGLGSVRISDTGVGTDKVSIIVKAGATVQDVYNMALTRASQSSVDSVAGVLASVLGIAGLLQAYVEHDKVVKKIGTAWYLIIYDAAGVGAPAPMEIFRKELRDINGNPITDLAAGILAKELRA